MTSATRYVVSPAVAWHGARVLVGLSGDEVLQCLARNHPAAAKRQIRQDSLPQEFVAVGTAHPQRPRRLRYRIGEPVSRTTQATSPPAASRGAVVRTCRQPPGAGAVVRCQAVRRRLASVRSGNATPLLLVGAGLSWPPRCREEPQPIWTRLPLAVRMPYALTSRLQPSRTQQNGCHGISHFHARNRRRTMFRSQSTSMVTTAPGELHSTCDLR